jgi:hypothetical protein
MGRREQPTRAQPRWSNQGRCSDRPGRSCASFRAQKGILLSCAHQNRVGSYRSLVDQVIVPNWSFFGPADAVVEIVVGLLLVLGRFTTLVWLG